MICLSSPVCMRNSTAALHYRSKASTNQAIDATEPAELPSRQLPISAPPSASPSSSPVPSLIISNTIYPHFTSWPSYAWKTPGRFLPDSSGTPTPTMLTLVLSTVSSRSWTRLSLRARRPWRMSSSREQSAKASMFFSR